jgi:2-oxoglutarate ferredoxin oxidoreductase subunit gamma
MPLACPLAEEVDVVVALAGLGWQAECRRLRRGGLGLVEPSEAGAAAGQGEVRVSPVPFARIAAEAGADRSSNVVAVGVLAGLTGAVPREALMAAVRRHLGAARAAPAALLAGLETGARLRETEGVIVEF